MIGAHVYAARINTDNRIDRYVDLGRRFRPAMLGYWTNILNLLGLFPDERRNYKGPRPVIALSL